MEYYIAINKKTGKTFAHVDYGRDDHRKVYANDIILPRLFTKDPLFLWNELRFHEISLDKFKLVEVELPVKL